MSNTIDFSAALKKRKVQKALRALEQTEADHIKNYGFYMHFVFPAGDTEWPEGYMDAHTHGLEYMAEHRNFQIALAIPQKTTAGILSHLANRALKGETISPGRNSGILEGHDVLIIEVTSEDGESLLRVILPDAAGNLDAKTIAPPFDCQYFGV